MDYKYKRLGKNTLLVFIGNAGSKLIGLLLLPFYTKYLSPEQYGVTDMIAVYASILLPIITACVTDGIFIFPKDADENGRKKYFSSGLSFTILTFCLCSLVFYGIDIYCSVYNYHSTFTNYIWWVLAMTVSNFLQGYVQQFCRSTDKMVVFSSTGIVQTVLMAGFAFLWVPTYGIEGYFWSLIAASLLSSVYSLVFSGSYKYLSFHLIDKIYLKELLAYGIPLIPNSIMWWLVNGINRPIMESLLGLHSIGIYSVAYKFPSMINLLFVIFSTALGISIIEEYKKPDFSSFYEKMIRLITVGLVLGGIILTATSKLIIHIFTTVEFYEAWLYVPLLTMAAIFQCISSAVGGVFSAAKTSKYFFYSSIWGAATSLLFTLLLIKLCGLIGVCIALVLSFFVLFITRIVYARKYVIVNIKPFLLLFCVFLFQIVIVMLDISLIINVVVSTSVFIFVIWQNKNLFLSIINQLKKK